MQDCNRKLCKSHAELLHVRMILQSARSEHKKGLLTGCAGAGQNNLVKPAQSRTIHNQSLLRATPWYLVIILMNLCLFSNCFS